MKVWIINFFDECPIEVALNANIAYNICRKYIVKKLKFDNEYEEDKCLTELAHSYSRNRNVFGVDGILNVNSVKVKEN